VVNGPNIFQMLLVLKTMIFLHRIQKKVYLLTSIDRAKLPHAKSSTLCLVLSVQISLPGKERQNDVVNSAAQSQLA